MPHKTHFNQASSRGVHSERDFQQKTSTQIKNHKKLKGIQNKKGNLLHHQNEIP